MRHHRAELVDGQQRVRMRLCAKCERRERLREWELMADAEKFKKFAYTDLDQIKRENEINMCSTATSLC